MKAATRWGLVLGAIIGCSRSSGPSGPSEAPTVLLPQVSDAAPAPAKRCLPVVAGDCGCVYACGLGVETAPGKYTVNHAFWGGTPLVAKVAPWCIDADCTDAFHAEIPCDGICPKKPADHSCHFDDEGRCVGSPP
ncbi:hypothetical protein BH09MYX1_BH09MYX1_61330 [soil metagenome]